MNNPQKPKSGRPSGKTKQNITVSVDSTAVRAFEAINEEMKELGGKISLSALVNNYLVAYLNKEYPGYLES